MCGEGSSRLPLTEDEINRYKKMTKDELDQLEGMEREQARYYSDHTFTKRYVLKPRKAALESPSPFKESEHGAREKFYFSEIRRIMREAEEAGLIQD